jgi:2,4-dienoyl-CoA reductase-like NADH-dependent reductase (Old Yellow Enzyme family)
LAEHFFPRWVSEPNVVTMLEDDSVFAAMRAYRAGAAIRAREAGFDGEGL